MGIENNEISYGFKDCIGGTRRKTEGVLITDFECNYYPNLLEHKKRVWISGEELTNLALENEVLQFIWGVLSAFRKSVNLDIDNLEIEPDIIMNNEIWIKPIVRHPLAVAEIVCWDSSATMLLSKDEDLTYKFGKYFPESEDFNEYIYRRGTCTE